MRCEDIQPKLYDLAFDLLEDSERRETEVHLLACQDCRSAYHAVLREKELLKRWVVPEPPEGLAEKAIAAAKAAPKLEVTEMRYEPVEPELRWLGSKRFWQVLAAACLMIVFGVGVQTLRVMTRHADPQEAFLYGPDALTPGLRFAYRAFVRNGRTSEPIHGAKVQFRLVSGTGKTVWRVTAQADDDGIAQVEPDVPDDAAEGKYRLELVAKSADGTSEIVREVAMKRSFRVMITTDKPLYQPGQVIHIRTLSLATADLRPVGGTAVVIEVKDAKGNKVFKKAGKTSDFGIFSGDFELADQVNTGPYTVSAAVGDTTSERTVSVETYRLPKFKIEVSLDKGFYLPGEVVKGCLSANYTFGEPVAGGRVSIVLSEFIEKSHPFGTVQGQTDPEGGFAFEVPLKQNFVGQELKKGDALVTLEAVVKDTADHEQKKSVDLTVTAEPIRIELFPESGTLVQGVENILYIVTAYPDGRPAQTKLTIGALGTETETSEVGIAKVKITPEQPQLQLTVLAEDKTGTKAEVTRVLRIDERNDSFLLRTDRAVYSTGQTAMITVLSPAKRERIFLDVIKDRRTALTKAIDVEDGRGLLALDLPPDLFGTLELHAYRIMRDGNMVGDTKVIQVNRSDDLVIQANLDKETYRPAETAILKFLVHRQGGEPVQAALGLAGVDEAVFALSEMRPGLERVYFMLQEEILKPRYEIHAQAPISAQQAVSPEVKPTPELEEASVVLFSSASASGTRSPVHSMSYPEKDIKFRSSKQQYIRQFKTVAALSPFAISFLLALPVFLYAFLKLFRRVPILDVEEQHRMELADHVRDFLIWWILGLYLPVVAAVVFLAFTEAFRLSRPESAALVAGVCVALLTFSRLLTYASRLSRCEAVKAVPLLGKVTNALPFAYFLAVAGIVSVFFANRVLSHVVGQAAVFGAWLAAAAVAGALSVAANSALVRVTIWRCLWLALSRPAFVALPVALIGLSLPSLARAQLRASTGQRAGVVAAAPGVEWRRVFRDELAAESMPTEGPPSEEAPPDEAPSAFGPATGALKSPARIRRHFPETLLWLPELITDESGRAEIDVPLADSITTWRLSMSAVSRQGQLGSGTKGIRVFQDFFVDIDFPVALTQHDQVSVPIAVYNYLEKPQTVRLEVQPDSWFRLLGEASQTLQIGPKQVTSVHFPLEAQTPGQHALTVKAFGSEMADAVERKVLVKPDGKEFVQTVNGRLTENLTQKILIPEGSIDGSLDLLVKIYPGAFSQVVEGLDSIFRMPGGCFEQTSSTTYPNVLALGYLRQTRQGNPETELKALQYINLGYQRLLSFEVEGGGFEWFGHAPAHNVLTAYGLMEFSDMAKVFEVDPAVIQRTRSWLCSQQRGDGSWKPTEGGIDEGAINQFLGAALRTTAYITWALAESGDMNGPTTKALDYVRRNAGTTEDPYTLAVCANALVAAKQPGATELLNRLMAMKQSEKEFVHWTSASQGVTYSQGNVLGIETTALAAYALLKAQIHTETAHKALAWLISQKDSCGTWHSTQATVHAMRALLAGTGPSAAVEGETHVTVAANGQLAKELTITPENSDVFHLVSLRPFVRKGENAITLETAGKGNLAYQIVATHYLLWPQGLTETQKELSIDVRYDTTSLKKDDLLTCGVALRYNRTGSAQMTIVDLGIPPGFEVIPDAFEQMKGGVIERYSLTGRQVILYFREIRGGEPVSFNYQLRAKFPVKAKTPTSVVYQYYEPEVRDEAEPVELTVL